MDRFWFDDWKVQFGRGGRQRGSQVQLGYQSQRVMFLEVSKNWEEKRVWKNEYPRARSFILVLDWRDSRGDGGGTDLGSNRE